MLYLIGYTLFPINSSIHRNRNTIFLGHLKRWFGNIVYNSYIHRCRILMSDCSETITLLALDFYDIVGLGVALINYNDQLVKITSSQCNC